MLAEALRLLRVFSDMKQKELADKLGLSNSHISEMENDNRTPSLEVLEKYADFFKIPVSSIMFFSEELPSVIGEGGRTSKMKTTYAKKIIGFLKLVEEKTEADGV